MRNLDRTVRGIEPIVRALSACPTNPPPYKRGTNGGPAKIGNCTFPDCCSCCNQPPPNCLNAQSGFLPPNCCQICPYAGNGVSVFKGKPIAIVSGTGCDFDGTWDLTCGIPTPSGINPIQGFSSAGNRVPPQSCGTGTFLFPGITASCQSTYRENYSVVLNPPIPILAQTFVFSIAINSINALIPSPCFSSGASINTRCVDNDITSTSPLSAPIVMSGTCYPLNLTATFYLYHGEGFNFGPSRICQGCTYCKTCASSGQVVITTDQGGF